LDGKKCSICCGANKLQAASAAYLQEGEVGDDVGVFHGIVFFVFFRRCIHGKRWHELRSKLADTFPTGCQIQTKHACSTVPCRSCNVLSHIRRENEQYIKEKFNENAFDLCPTYSQIIGLALSRSSQILSPAMKLQSCEIVYF
jgi:hypothetical protein